MNELTTAGIIKHLRAIGEDDAANRMGALHGACKNYERCSKKKRQQDSLMSESAIKKLRAEVARLQERIDVHRDKEIKLLDDILQLREENRRLRDTLRRQEGG